MLHLYTPHINKLSLYNFSVFNQKCVHDFVTKTWLFSTNNFRAQDGAEWVIIMVCPIPPNYYLCHQFVFLRWLYLYEYNIKIIFGILILVTKLRMKKGKTDRINLNNRSRIFRYIYEQKVLHSMPWWLVGDKLFFGLAIKKLKIFCL